MCDGTARPSGYPTTLQDSRNLRASDIGLTSERFRKHYRVFVAADGDRIVVMATMATMATSSSYRLRSRAVSYTRSIFSEILRPLVTSDEPLLALTSMRRLEIWQNTLFV